MVYHVSDKTNMKKECLSVKIISQISLFDDTKNAGSVKMTVDNFRRNLRDVYRGVFLEEKNTKIRKVIPLDI